MIPAAAIAAGQPHGRPVRVMIVDDAVVVRGLMARWFGEAGGIEVISTHRTGAEAVAAVERAAPDVIVLDIDMPDMDGVTALPLILRKAPGTTVIIASTLTTRNAEISLRCLSLGAADYIGKPSTNRDVTFSTDFRREIVEKVKQLGMRRHRPAAGMAPRGVRPEPREAACALRPLARSRPGVLMIGASTGGPNAVTSLLKLVKPVLEKMPIVVAQHMPPVFTAMFAEHLSRTLSVDANEAVDGERIQCGRVYIAPGGRHLRLVKDQTVVKAVVDDSPPVNFCRPSVDVSFKSAARSFGRNTLGVLLTGMGTDGANGGEEIVTAGGNILAQDEASSVVWGMPGAAAKRGICAAVEPVEEIARIVMSLSGGERP